MTIKPARLWNIGDRLPERKYRITQEKINRYSRYVLGGKDVANIHTSSEVARRAGLSGPVAHGRYPIAFLSEAMLEAFGADWLQSGILDVTLVRPIFPGDELKVTAVLKDIRETGVKKLLAFDIALINQDDEPATAGTTEVTLSS